MVSEAKSLSTKDKPSIWGLLKSLVHLVLADLWSRVGWVNEVVRRQERALAAEPYQPWIRRHQVELLAGLERWEDAVASARELVRLTPEDPLAHQVVATCLESLERYEEAFGEYERASELAPESLEFKLNALVCLLRLGRDEEHKERLRELMRQHPESGGLRAMLGMMIQTEGNVDEALRLYQEAHSLEPESPILETVGEVFLEPAESPKQKKRKRRKNRK